MQKGDLCILGGLIISADMTVQDQSSSETAVHSGSPEIMTSDGLQSITSMQAEQYPGVNDYAVKVRKPYTITKQRERWTEEEHKKFLEALKLYGRAWRKIEEHVGSKTAVQIRSHAQKFFSKVVRESNGNNTSSLDPIEIPPPRPKRKPIHPYPRKLVHSNSKESITQEQSVRSESPIMSASELENQSPTSVLSTMGSDAFASTGSSTPKHGFSPDSSTEDAHIHDAVPSEANLQVEDDVSPSVPTGVPSSSKNLELFLRISNPSKPIANKAITQSLKLFGKTMVVNESSNISSSNISSSSISERGAQPADGIYPIWSKFAHGDSRPICLVQIRESNSQLIEPSTTSSMPYWTVYGNMPISYIPFLDGKESLKEHPESTSVTPCSHSGAASASEANEKNEVQSRLPSTDKEVGSGKLKASPEKPARGFVPYKRCKLEKPTQSSTGMVQEMEEGRIRLSL